MRRQNQGDAASSAKAAARDAAKAAQDAADAAQAAAPPPAPVQTNVLADLGRLTYRQLENRLRELQNQRTTISQRRSALADTYENATGANRDGIGSRLRVLDNNIVQFEFEIAAVAREMAVKAGTQQPPPPPPIRPGYSDDDMAGAVFTTFLGTSLVVVLLMRRFMRRRWGVPKQTAEVQGPSSERLDRIEGAVDTIAVEIERISENQRFMTRLMTETQLGASIAAVRSSTEMAKSAAAEVPVGVDDR